MKKIKTDGGNTGIDIVISLGIISITAVILAILYFNAYISNVEVERRAQAISYASQIFEKISEYYYDDITAEQFAVTTNTNGMQEIVGVEIPTPYTIDINIENYKTDEATDVVKTITLQITYNVGEKANTLTLKRYKTKETLLTLNAPELAQNMTPVKVQKLGDTSTYKTTSITDEDWYNYYGKRWAIAKDSSVGTTVSVTDLYVWIPRYAYYTDENGNTNIEFLYSNENQKVGLYGNLEDYTSGYNVDEERFSGDNERGYWVKISEIANDETANRLNESEYGPLIY